MKVTADRCRYFYGECHVVTDKVGKVVAMFSNKQDAERYAKKRVKK